MRKKQITSKVEVDWKWPVQFGFIPTLDIEANRNRFKEGHWLRRLAHGFALSKVRRKCNILLLEGSPGRILKGLRDLGVEVKCDLLILVLSGKRIRGEKDLALAKILKAVKWNSLFICVKPSDGNLLFWLDEIIFGLSHNNSIDIALEMANWEGRLAYTEELLSESKVSIVFDKILDRIGRNHKFNNYKFRDVLTEEILRRMDAFSGRVGSPYPNAPKGIVRSAKKRNKGFEYHHESDESTILRDIVIKDSEQVSDMMETLEASSEKKTGVSESTARYLQYLFEKDGIPSHHALQVNQNYALKVKIDAPDHAWMQGGSVSSDDVAVSDHKPEQIDLFLQSVDTSTHEPIWLPSKGSSTEASFHINEFDSREKIYELFAFHKSRLFQHISISVYFCNSESEIPETPGIKTELISMPRTVMNDFDLKEQYGLSIIVDNGKATLSKEAQIWEYREEDGMNKLNNLIRKDIESYLKSKAPDANSLLLKLAKRGSQLYKNYFHEKGDFSKPIQIISDLSSHLPLEFLYTKKITRKTKVLCPSAKVALGNGVCSNCCADGASYICPFGFLSLSTVIERHRLGENVDELKRGDFGLRNEVSLIREAIPVLQKTVFGTGETVEKHTANLRAEVATTIDKCTVESQEVQNWDEWVSAIDLEPDSLVIIGHVEPEKDGFLEQLEIGKDLLDISFLDESFVVKESSDSRPILILIGCSTQDLDLSFLDFTRTFKQNGAAIVLSTFTKIRGRHAGPLVQRLFEILHSRKGGEFRFGEIMLELRRKLFAEGIYVSMSLVSHGDADWKLKI